MVNINHGNWLIQSHRNWHTWPFALGGISSSVHDSLRPTERMLGERAPRLSMIETLTAIALSDSRFGINPHRLEMADVVYLRVYSG